MTKKLLLKARMLIALAVILLFSLPAVAQIKVTGSVVGADGNQPIIGASVKIQGTTIGAVTDLNGSFSITAKINDIIVISYIGYDPLTVVIKDALIGSVTLTPSKTNLNEVLVTGYTSQRKKDITGAVAIVDVASMKSVPAGNTSTLLQGQASGVTVTNSGAPGGGTSINIRGIGSIFSTAPLVMIDGVSGSLDNINVSDIESIQILKDAGSASIYGVRGANGVVVVTTKKGKGKIKVTYDGLYGTTRPLADGFKLANTEIYEQAEYQSYKNDGLVGAGHPNTQFDPRATGNWSIPTYITPAGANPGDPNTDPSTYNLNPITGVGTNPITLANKSGTDWFHTVFRPAPTQTHTVTASGGSDVANYLLSIGYLDQQGTLLSTYDKRYSVRVNTNFSPSSHFRIGENAYLFYNQNPSIAGNNQSDNNIISMVYREPSIIPVYDISGNFAGTRSNGLSNADNPYAIAYRHQSDVNNDWNMSGNLYGEFDFLKHFTYRMSFGGSVNFYQYNNFAPTPYENAEVNTSVNTYNDGYGYGSNYTWGNYVNYSQQFGKHNIKAIIGTEAITSYGKGITASRGNYTLSVDPNYVNLNTGDPKTQQNGDAIYSNTLLSYFARVEYAYNDKYLFSGNIRRDGSSFFAPGHQYGLFPSGSIGWRISKEDILKGVDWLNDLKLRVGYGSLGALNGVSASPYNAYNLYAASPGTLYSPSSYYDINGTGTSAVIGTYKSQQGNVSTSWETDKVANIGLDVSVVNKIDFSIDVYKKTVSGLLFRQSAFAYNLGAAQPFVNSGNLQNTGFDFNINFHDQINDFKYSVGFNISHYSNLVKSLPSGIAYIDEASAGSSRLGSFVRLQPGEPLGEFFGYKEIGLYQNAADVTNSPGYTGAAPGLIKYEDINHDGKIDASDRTFIGNPNPKFTAGLNFQASYKGFDLSAFLYSVYGNKVVNYTKFWTDFPQVYDGNVSANIITDSWHAGADNSHATIPVLTRQANLGNTGAFTSYYIENGSFLRLKSLQVGYTFTSKMLKYAGVSKLRLFVLGNNLFTVTKYSGLDPELQNSNLSDNTSFGIDFGNYPANEKRYSVGVQATF